MATLHIAFLGGSMTNGTGNPTMLGWVGRICASAAARWHAKATARRPAKHLAGLSSHQGNAGP